jgi:chromosomal replication initiation ATPase DnaA
MTTTLQQLEAEKRAIQQRIEPLTAGGARRIKLEWEIIMLLCAEQFGVDPHAMRKRTRAWPITDARQAAMALIRTHYDHPLPVIARFFNRRAHFTIQLAVKSASAKCETDQKFKAKFDAVEKILIARFQNRQDKAA